MLPFEIDPAKSEKLGVLYLFSSKGEERKIPFSKSVVELKNLAAQGGILFQGKKVLPDFFAPFQLLLEMVPEGKEWRVAGKIKRGSQVYNLEHAAFICIGPPHWVIIEGFLYLLDEDAPWKWLKKYSAKIPWILTLEKALELAEECREMDIPCESALLVPLPPPSACTPILQLCDRTGALADLWIDYGSQGKAPFHFPLEPLKSGKRDSKQEEAFEKDLVETGYQRKLVEDAHFYCSVEKVIENLTFLIEVGWQVIDSQGRRVLLQTQCEIFSQQELGRIQIKGRLSFGDASAPLSSLLNSSAQRRAWIDLGNNRVGLLTDTRLIDQVPQLLSEGELTSEGISLPTQSISTLIAISEAVPLKVEGELSDLTARLKDFRKVEDYFPSRMFQGTLRPYQQQGVNWLAFLRQYGFHGILADDMGLGKTVQVLAFFSTQPMALPILIVVPKSLLFHWEREISRFLGSGLAVVYHGNSREQQRKALGEQKILITTYHTLRQEIELFRSLSLEAIILDEAQTIKNASTQIFRAICTLSAPFRLSITGTPVENRLDELWAQFRFLMPELLGPQEKFVEESLAASSDPSKWRRLQKKLRPFILRRRKEEVAEELPEKSEQSVWIEMDEGQRGAYDSLLQSYRGNLLKKVDLDGIASHRMEVFEAILRLRQICCHPLLVDALLPAEHERSSSKLEALLTDLETVVSEGSKVLVYSQFTSMLTLIKKSIQEKGWRCLYLDGSTQNRQEVVDRFQNNAEEQIFLISLKAGGVGLNLTAADYVFLFDPWWNEAVENQAIDRAHRIGRTKPVIAKRFLMKESIEERMMLLKEQKRGLIAQLLEGDTAGINLSVEDFRFLIS